MAKERRLIIALAVAFGFLMATELLSPYLPSSIRWLGTPSALIGGAFIFGGPQVGFFVAITCVIALTALFYWVVGLFLAAPPMDKVPRPND